MNFLKYIWTWFTGLFVSVGATQPPAEPTLITEGFLEPAATEVEELEPAVPVDFSSDGIQMEDLACVDGTPVPEEYRTNAIKLAVNLDALSEELGKPVIIVDAFRTETYNKHIGGNKNSQHLTCSGAEVKVKGMSRDRLATKIKALIKEGKLEKGGVAVYPNGVHYDVRGKNLSWTGKRNKK